MSTNNIGFNGELTIIIFQLSSNTHIIYSSVGVLFFVVRLCLLMLIAVSYVRHFKY